jgi:hypothetical protein
MFDAVRLNNRNASSALELGRSFLLMKTVSTCANALGSSSHHLLYQNLHLRQLTVFCSTLCRLRRG